METTKKRIKKISLIVGIAVLVIGLLFSIGFNIYFALAYIKAESYLQSVEEIYVMEAGILKNNLEFQDGESYEFDYDFSHGSYETLKERYGLERTAKDGTEFERATRLMNEYAPRLTHKSNYDNHIAMNSLDLLEYSLDDDNHGINCRAKAQILNEMCLSLGIYSRKVWILPYSAYDGDCHVVNEVWDSALGKWVMLDITNNTYWVDENSTPLSVLEIRDKAALQEFCTPVEVGDSTKNLQKLKDKNIGNFIYIIKNMYCMNYCAKYGAGESNEIYLLMPRNMETTHKIIARAAVESAPI